MDLTAIELTKRSYAVGIQEFEHFRTKGSVYSGDTVTYDVNNPVMDFATMFSIIKCDELR
jgi:hypothetical protein